MKPTPTEMERVEKLLLAQPAFAAHLGPQVSVEKRTRKIVQLHAATVAVATALMTRKINPERAHVGVVLRVAAEQFGIIRPRGDVAPAT